ncbi:MAG: hypothetical protein GY795_46665 [Desulfobacterales bacterium]|nr:hypothetical protein [Desulfobacterales bacterium]
MKERLITLITILFFVVPAGNIQAFEFEEVDIHGFVSQGYMKSDRYNFYAETEDGSFQFNELGINFSSNLSDNLRLGIQFFARDLGDLGGNNDINIDWAFADYRWKDWLGLTAGKIKVPLGFYNETRDIDMLRTSILLPQSLYSERWRETFMALQGVGIYGNIFLNVMGNLTYHIQYGTKNRDDEAFERIDVDEVAAASLKWETPIKGLEVGASALKEGVDFDIEVSGPPNMPAGMLMTIDYTYNPVIFSLEYTIGKLMLSSEYSLISWEYETRMSGALTNTGEMDSEGYYISASYRFTDLFELGAYYSVYYENKDNKDGESFVAQGQADYRAWSKDIALTTRFNISDNWIFKLEGHFMDGTGLVFRDADYEDIKKDWFLFAAKMTFSF